MCFFVCVKSWEGGLFGTMVLFRSYSYFCQGGLVIIINVHPIPSSLSSLYKVAHLHDIDSERAILKASIVSS